MAKKEKLKFYLNLKVNSQKSEIQQCMVDGKAIWENIIFLKGSSQTKGGAESCKITFQNNLKNSIPTYNSELKQIEMVFPMEEFSTILSYVRSTKNLHVVFDGTHPEGKIISCLTDDSKKPGHSKKKETEKITKKATEKATGKAKAKVKEKVKEKLPKSEKQKAADEKKTN